MACEVVEQVQRRRLGLLGFSKWVGYLNDIFDCNTLIARVTPDISIINIHLLDLLNFAELHLLRILLILGVALLDEKFVHLCLLQLAELLDDLKKINIFFSKQDIIDVVYLGPF